MNTEKKKYEIFVNDDRHDIDTQEALSAFLARGGL